MSTPRINGKLRRQRENFMKDCGQQRFSCNDMEYADDDGGGGGVRRIPEPNLEERGDCFSEFENMGDGNLDVPVSAMEDEELLDWMSELLQGETQSENTPSDYQDKRDMFGDVEAESRTADGIKIESVQTMELLKHGDKLPVYGSAPTNVPGTQSCRTLSYAIPGVYVSSFSNSIGTPGQHTSIRESQLDLGASSSNTGWSQNSLLIHDSTRQLPVQPINRGMIPYTIVKPSTSCPANMAEEIGEYIGSYVLNDQQQTQHRKCTLKKVLPVKSNTSLTASVSGAPCVATTDHGAFSSTVSPSLRQHHSSKQSQQHHHHQQQQQQRSSELSNFFMLDSTADHITGGTNSQGCGSFLSFTSPNISHLSHDDLKISRDRLKKDSHNRVERRRRNFINLQIEQLGSLLPCGAFIDAESKRNKGSILCSAVSYLTKCQSMERVYKESEKIIRKTTTVLPALWKRIKFLESLLNDKSCPISSSDDLHHAVEDILISCHTLDEERKQSELMLQTFHERSSTMSPTCQSTSHSPITNINVNNSSNNLLSSLPIACGSGRPSGGRSLLGPMKYYSPTSGGCSGASSSSRLVDSIDMRLKEVKTEKTQYTAFATSAPANMFPGNLNSEPASILCGEEAGSLMRYDMDVDEVELSK